MTKTNFMCQEKEKEDSPVFKITWVYQYEASKTSLKRKKE